MWISAGRDENFRIRGQTLISSRRIAGTVTYHTINESDPLLAMQMDSTTLQLIQVLERTVSSGECWSRAVVPWRRHKDRLALLRPSVFSPIGKRDARRDDDGGGSAGCGGGGDSDLDLEHARADVRKKPRARRCSRSRQICRNVVVVRPLPRPILPLFRRCARGRHREPFRTLLRAISRPVVLLLGALSAAGKVLSRVTVACIRTHSRDTHRDAPRARLTCAFLRFSAR